MDGTLRERLRLQAVARAAGATWRWPYRLPHPPDRRPARQIELGEGTFVGRDAWVNLNGPHARLRIGAGTVIANDLMINCGGTVEIGAGVLFSDRVCLLDQVHDFERWLAVHDRPPHFSWDMSEPLPVSIGPGSWLGVGVVVLPGVSIGTGCVIGANAVVTADVPDYTVAAGVPARHIRAIAR